MRRASLIITAITVLALTSSVLLATKLHATPIIKHIPCQILIEAKHPLADAIAALNSRWQPVRLRHHNLVYLAAPKNIERAQLGVMSLKLLDFAIDKTEVLKPGDSQKLYLGMHTTSVPVREKAFNQNVASDDFHRHYVDLAARLLAQAGVRGAITTAVKERATELEDVLKAFEFTPKNSTVMWRLNQAYENPRVGSSTIKTRYANLIIFLNRQTEQSIVVYVSLPQRQDMISVLK